MNAERMSPSRNTLVKLRRTAATIALFGGLAVGCSGEATPDADASASISAEVSPGVTTSASPSATESTASPSPSDTGPIVSSGMGLCYLLMGSHFGSVTGGNECYVDPHTGSTVSGQAAIYSSASRYGDTVECGIKETNIHGTICISPDNKKLEVFGEPSGIDVTILLGYNAFNPENALRVGSVIRQNLAEF